MTELSIRPDEIRDALQRFVSDYKPETASKEEVGPWPRPRTASPASAACPP